MDFDLDQLPIPDWGLHCPKCRYPLRGLPRHRCPECGTAFEMRDMVPPSTRVRAPRIVGLPLPIPDWGLVCLECRYPLRGLPTHRCPECGTRFDLETLRAAGEWFTLDAGMCPDLPFTHVLGLLQSEYVPHIPQPGRSVGQVYGLQPQDMPITRVKVATEFYYEVLWLIRGLREQLAASRAAARKTWRCAHCGEKNPGSFEVCWSCETDRPVK
ncbi:MAG: hypothetical protein AB1716_12115 [Planctomycetota bacterium]